MESSRHEQTINVLKKRLDDKEDAHTSAIEAMESSHKETINALEKRLADERNAHSSTQSRLSADLRRLIGKMSQAVGLPFQFSAA
jgi:DNA anti-recombination protein RmuC